EQQGRAPTVQRRRVREEDEDRAEARARDDQLLQHVEDEIHPVLELVLRLDLREEAEEPRVARDHAPAAEYWRTPARQTIWKRTYDAASHATCPAIHTSDCSSDAPPRRMSVGMPIQ